ncbi:uncharacterized protein K02A2.6-like [Lytechinus pictus]|uniref:uncharacterized protein K02A2.6-like n=1 Tax=Lytechinus pictus TaxID=7653 RepID=UPI0030B9BB60
MNDSVVPKLSWEDEDLPGAIQIFKQQCELYFSVKNVREEKQVDHILLFMGTPGLRMYNSWDLAERDRKNIAVVWNRFEKQLKPKSNFRVARLYLQRFRQQESETADSFVSKLKLHAQTCQFRDDREFADRVVEQFIAGTRHTELQKQLLGQDELNIQQCLDYARTHEASISHMQQLAGVRSQLSPAVHVIQHKRDCRNCGRSHSFSSRESCPAYNTTCNSCGKKNHWSKMCRSKQGVQASRGRQQRDSSGRDRERRQQTRSISHKRGKQRSSSRNTWTATRDVHYTDAHTPPAKDDTGSESFDQLSLNAIFTSLDAISDQSDDEAFTRIQIRQDEQELIINLLVKVDTGSQVNTIPLRVYRRMFPSNLDADGFPRKGHLKDTSCVLTVYNETAIKHYGTVTLPCRHGNTGWINADFHVCDTSRPAILGLRTSKALQLVALTFSIDSRSVQDNTQRDPIRSVADLKSQYPQQFDAIGDFAGEYHIVLNDGAHPVVHAPRKCSIHIRDELKAALDDMEKQGVIRRVTEPTDWVSSLAISRKANGQLRICLDPKDLNSAIKRCHHTTPTVQEITHKLTGATVFSKLDAKHGYWSVHLDAESQLLTTFNSPFGRYSYKRMPFGLVMSQDVFQHRMDQILEQCTGVIGIADDIVVFGDSQQSHDRNLHALMEVAAKSGLKFNSNKCSINQERVVFFGMVYDKHGVHPDPAKVQAVRSMPTPRDKTQLQEFLGMATYLSPFIPNLSSRTADLRELLRQDNEFVWSENHQRAMDDIRDQICESATLRYFDPNKESIVQVDASSRGLGATLLQDGEPIAFASKALSDAETRYANIEREMLAVVFGCERFHMYVFGKHFTVESDHKPLQMIHQKPLTSAPPRLQRMLLRLQQYDFNLIYRPGKEVPIADSLSRSPGNDNTHIALDMQINHIQFTEQRIADVKRETDTDSTLSQLKCIIGQGWPERMKDLPSQLRPYWSFRDELSVEDGIIMKGPRVVVPKSMHEYVLGKLHEGHQGSTKTKLRARDCVYWLNINSNIESVVNQCATCQKHQRSQPKEELLPHELPTRPWQILGTDLFHFEGREYLIIADYYSKFPLVRRMPVECTSKAVIEATQQIFSEHGIPEKVVSDNGPHFASSAYKEFASNWNFAHVTSSPHFPQSNGFVERAIQTIKRTLAKATSCKQNINMALLCLRTTPIDSELPSPAELLCGRKFKSNLPLVIHNTSSRKEQHYQRLQQRQDQQKAYHDRSAHNLQPLRPSQRVMVQDARTHLWIPGQVEECCDEPRSYTVVTSNGRELRRNRQQIRDLEPAKKRVTFDETPHYASTPETRQREQTHEQQSRDTRPRDPKVVENKHQQMTRSGRLIRPPDRFTM